MIKSWVSTSLVNGRIIGWLLDTEKFTQKKAYLIISNLKFEIICNKKRKNPQNYISHCNHGFSFEINSHLLFELVKNGLGIGYFIASNGMNQVQIKRLKKAGIYDYFEKIYISECIGYNKPDKEFFEYIIQDIKDDNTKEYIMIGDRYDTDIMGAKKVGIDGILLSKEKKDCITISSIKDILNIL